MVITQTAPDPKLAKRCSKTFAARPSLPCGAAVAIVNQEAELMPVQTQK